MSAVLCVPLLAACGGSDDRPGTTLSPATVQALDAAIDRELASANLPSAAVGIWIDNRQAYLAARGPDRLGSATPRSTDDPFRVASITKTFIGTAILMLADDGKLRLTDPLATWYPSFPNATKIRVVDLLRMRSGIPDTLGKDFLREYYADPLLKLGPEDVIARAAALPLSQFDAPDTKTVYVNLNFAILERIVEKASGQDIRSVLKARIFGPLGLAHTVYPTGPVLDGPLHGYSYEAATGRLVDYTLLDPSGPGGAGALVSTLDDLRKYGRALCAGGLLKPETQAARLVTTPFDGLGGVVAYGNGVGRLGPFCGHNGTIFGFSSEMWYLPSRDAIIVINVARLDADDESQSSALFGKVARLAFPDEVK